MSEIVPLDHEHKALLQTANRLKLWINKETDQIVRQRLELELKGIETKTSEHVRYITERHESREKKYMFR